MIKDEIRVGVILRVERVRWDAPVGSVATVETVGEAGVPREWCFTVRWLYWPRNERRRNRRSLNLWEADLLDFALTDHLVPSPAIRHGRVRKAIIPGPKRPQLSLPLIYDDYGSG